MIKKIEKKNDLHNNSQMVVYNDPNNHQIANQQNNAFNNGENDAFNNGEKDHSINHNVNFEVIKLLKETHFTDTINRFLGFLLPLNNNFNPKTIQNDGSITKRNKNMFKKNLKKTPYILVFLAIFLHLSK